MGMRVPEAMGGSGSGLVDAAILAEEAGRRIASGPIVESIIAQHAANGGISVIATHQPMTLAGTEVKTLHLDAS